MSYTVLARRYRSGTFDEVIGQDHIAQTLKKAIESDRIAHAYLFCGTRGTGKTSTARILAKCLNCEASDKPTTLPCGKCGSCQGIARGDDIDVIEIDAASNTGVDNVRGIIENAAYRPARARFKVYIIDEVHMLSKQAFNALLKIMEEPPGHVKFILATTEPEKVLATILSRCQRYDFRNIPTREIAGHLREICKKEKIDADDDALLMVAKAGAGSMRDSLSLLDRLLSIGETKLTTDMIEHLLGLPKTQLVFNLADAVGRGDVKATLGQSDAMVQSGLSPDTLVASLVDHLRNLLILRTCGNDSGLVEVPGLAPGELARQAQQFEAVTLAQDITILEELRRHMRQSQAGRALLDATLARLAMAEQFTPIEELLARLNGGAGMAGAPVQKKKYDVGEGAGSGVRGSGEAGSGVRVPGSGEDAASGAFGIRNSEFGIPSPSIDNRQSTVGNPPSPFPEPGTRNPEPVATLETVAVAQSVESAEVTAASDDSGNDDLPAVGRVWEGPKMSLGAAFARSRAPQPAVARPAESNVEPVGGQDLGGIWSRLLDALSSKSPGLRAMVEVGSLVRIDDDSAVIRYGPEHETFTKMLERNGKRELVRDAFSQVLQRSIGVQIELSADAPPRTAVSPPASGSSASPSTPAPQSRTPEPGPRNPSQNPTANVAAAAPSRIPEPPAQLTPEQLAELAKEPMIKAVLDEFGGQIVRVE